MSENKCTVCSEPTTPNKNFCPNCGAPQLPSAQLKELVEEIIKSHFQDQKYVALETSVAAADTLTNWLKTFLYWAAIPLGLIALLLAIIGISSFHDFKSKIGEAETRVEGSAQDASAKVVEAEQKVSQVSNEIDTSRRELEVLQKTSERLNGEYANIQTDVGRYSEVNKRIEEVQRQLTDIKGEVVDLGNKTLKVGKIESTSAGPSAVEFGRPGCGPKALIAGMKVAYCANEYSVTPFIFLFQRTPSGDERAVSSISPNGFQDVSLDP
jgi:hypothetical protein